MSTAEAVRWAETAEAAAQADLFAAAPPAFAAAVGLRAERLADATLLLAPGIPSPYFNRVIGLGVHEPATEESLDAVCARYRAAGVRQHWIHLSPLAQPQALAAWLTARGFAPPQRRSWVQMQWPDTPPPHSDSTLQVREVHAHESQALGLAIAEAFEMPPSMGPWLAGVVGRPGWRAFGAYDEDALVGGGCVYVTGPLAWLGMGAIKAGYRGRGGQVALMATRIRHARDHGCRSIHTETGEPTGDEPNPSLDNMYRCGFRRIASRLNYAAPVAA